MKKVAVFLIILVVFFAGYGIWFLEQFSRVKMRVGRTKIKGYSLANRAVVPFEVEIVASNFSRRDFKLKQIFLEILDPETKEPIATQDAPLSQPVNLPVRINTLFPIVLNFELEKLAQMLNQPLDTLAQNLILGKLGKQVLVRGFVVVSGLKLPIIEELKEI
ncbi:MAG: hypothetical protein MUC49_14810 [Raineya sp.]|jgi:hypothetical protein|nr:hypothetical protein [Raineya sp.]